MFSYPAREAGMIWYGGDLLSSDPRNRCVHVQSVPHFAPFSQEGWGEPTTQDATPEAIWLHEHMERTRDDRERSEKMVKLTRSQVCQLGKIHQCNFTLDLIFRETSYMCVC